ncbi:MAG: alpha/beta hydrolase family protein [Gemmatimonadaceae bacterium]
MRILTVLATLGLLGCKTVTLSERQFFDPRPASLPDSVRAASYWPAPYSFSEGFFTSGDGTRLFRVTVTRPSADIAVLYFGGSNFQVGQDWRRFTPLMKTGAAIFAADYPGYGQSEGVATLDAFEVAALAAYDEVLRVTGLPAERIVVHGHSLGTMLATYVAVNRKIGALVLEGPATNAREWAGTFTPWFAKPFVRFDIPKSLLGRDNLARIRSYRGPLLVLAGEEDRETRPAMARRLYAASATPPALKRLVVFPATGHMILLREPKSIDAYSAFLEQLR